MGAPQPSKADQRPHKRHPSPQSEPLPYRKRTCQAGLLLVGSLESETSPLGAAAAAAVGCAVPPSPTTAGSPAGAGAAVGPAVCSAESSSSSLLPTPRAALPGAAMAPEAAPVRAAACRAAAGATSDGSAPAAEATLVLPCHFLDGLAAANECLKQLMLPGGIPYTPVHPCCAMLPLCCVYGAPPAAVALGASYFQRLLAGSEPLRISALQCGFFSFDGHEAVVHAVPGCPDLLAILCICIYLGIKLTEGPQFTRQLSSMLSHVLGMPVPTEKAADLEMRCLKNLRWCLGPYCCAPVPTRG